MVLAWWLTIQPVLHDSFFHNLLRFSMMVLKQDPERHPYSDAFQHDHGIRIALLRRCHPSIHKMSCTLLPLPWIITPVASSIGVAVATQIAALLPRPTAAAVALGHQYHRGPTQRHRRNKEQGYLQSHYSGSKCVECPQ